MKLFVHRKDDIRKIACFDGKSFVEFDADVTEKESIVGAIYCGRVLKVTQDYALLDVDRKNPAFLSEPAGLREGHHLIVQVKREEVADKGKNFTGSLKKGLVVTRTIQVVTPYFVFQPSGTEKTVNFAKTVKNPNEIQVIGGRFLKDKTGIITFRSRAETAAQENLENALESTYKAWQMSTHIGKKPGFLLSGRQNLERIIDEYQPEKIIMDSLKDYWEIQNYVKAYPFPCDIELRQDNFFEKCGAAEEWDTLISPWIKTPSGGVICIENTSTFISFDINQAESKLPIAQLNIEAARMIPEIIKKLQLNGNIIIDFAGNIQKAQQADILGAIQKFLTNDATHVHWSNMGWLEMRRPRTRATLLELFNNGLFQ